MSNARSIQEGQSSSAATLRQLIFDIPGGGGGDLSRDLDDVQGMRAGQPGGLDPSQMSPQELHDTLWKILKFRDNVMKKIEVSSRRSLYRQCWANVNRIQSTRFLDSALSLKSLPTLSPSSSSPRSSPLSSLFLVPPLLLSASRLKRSLTITTKKKCGTAPTLVILLTPSCQRCVVCYFSPSGRTT
jgi:hypothetical protein